MTAETIRDRGTAIDVTDDAIIFEMERQTSSSGALYRTGVGMSAAPERFDSDYDRLSEEIILNRDAHIENEADVEAFALQMGRDWDLESTFGRNYFVHRQPSFYG